MSALIEGSYLTEHARFLTGEAGYEGAVYAAQLRVGHVAEFGDGEYNYFWLVTEGTGNPRVGRLFRKAADGSGQTEHLEVGMDTMSVNNELAVDSAAHFVDVETDQVIDTGKLEFVHVCDKGDADSAIDYLCDTLGEPLL